MMCSSFLWYFVLFVSLEFCTAAQNDICYTSGSITGIVIATVVVTLVTGVLAAASIWFLWKQRKGASDKDPEKKQAPNYAFDNPYFKDDETDHVKHDAAEKGESGFRTDNGVINGKAANGTTGGPKKNRPFSSLPFFHPSGKKQKATMDDTYIAKHLERVTVPLRGHDFTGLGFNIYGNMRDGIYVKDVLHRGPASESGKIKAGDRLISLTVSFESMVYEDALTILSYASPYDVSLEVEKCGRRGPGVSSSLRTGAERRLFHPLYRSHSIDDLTKIGKDSSLGGHSPAVQSKSSKESSSVPKRSQSVETSSSRATTPRVPLMASNDATKNSRQSSTSSSSHSLSNNITAVAPPEKTDCVSSEEVKCMKTEVKSSRFRVEQISVKTEAPEKPVREVILESKQPALANGDIHSELADNSILNNGVPEQGLSPEGDKVPTAPPRKTTNGAKRKAPAPPPAPTTSATIHRADINIQQDNKISALELDSPPPQPTTAPPSASSNHLPDMEEVTEITSPESSKEKRKASSLGDLTKLEQKKNTVASTILERAVSLDLQQSIPGESLVRQKRILKAPAFDHDCDEIGEIDVTETDSPGGLKRWEEGLDKMPGLTNGHIDHDDDDDVVTSAESPEEFKSAKKIVRVELNLAPSPLDKEEKSLLTSTPIKKTKEEVETTQLSSKIFSPVRISIPIIKPDMKNFENLPSPPADSNLGWRTSKVTSEIPFKGTSDISFDASTVESDKTTADVSIVKSDASVITSDLGLSKTTWDISKITSDSSIVSQEPLPKVTADSSGVTFDSSFESPSEVTYDIPKQSPAVAPKPSFNVLPETSQITFDASSEVTSTPEVNSPGATDRLPLERISVHSLYRPIFGAQDEKVVNSDEDGSQENVSASTSFNTAQEDTVSQLDISSSSSVTLGSPVKATPNSVAGFAKTLIVPGPDEVEHLLNLAAEPNTPPAQHSETSQVVLN